MPSRRIAIQATNLRHHLAPFALLPLLACHEEPGKKRSPTETGTVAPDTGPAPDPDCDSGYLDDGGDCVPAACGSGTWGDLERDESTVYVDIAAAEGGDGSETAPFTSIQAGLDAAADADGGMVAVAAGTYPATLALSRSHDGVRLAGRCRELVVIDASAGDEGTPGIDIDVRMGEAELSGVTVSGSRYIGVLVGSGTVTLRQSAMAGNEYVGLWAHTSASMYGTSLAVESCEVADNATGGVLAHDSGTSVSLRDTTIQDTQPNENGSFGYGIQVWAGATLSAEACVLDGNAATGLAVMDSGSAVTLSETTIRNTHPNDSGETGHGIHVQDGGELTAESCLVQENSEVGVVAYGQGAQVVLRETTIQDSQPDANLDFGWGLQITGGAALAMEGCTVEGNTGHGLLLSDAESRATLREVTIRDTHPGANNGWGRGIEVSGGAILSAESCVIEASAEEGIVAEGAGTVVTLEETIIRDTQPGPVTGLGYGLAVGSGACLTAEACLLERNVAAGVIVADSGTEATLRGTTIRQTQQDDYWGVGYGLAVYGGASLTLEGASLVEACSQTAVSATDADTELTLRETTIRDTRPGAGGKTGAGIGYGIEVSGGASLEAEACEVEGSRAVGLLVAESGSSAAIRATSIRDTKARESGGGGYGIEVYGGASLEAESCEVEGNTAVGVVVSDPGSAASLRQTIIRDTQPQEGGVGGYGIEVVDDASLFAESCELVGNAAVGVAATGTDTSVSLRDTVIASTRRAEIYTIGIGIAAQVGARIEGRDLTVSANEGPGIYVASEQSRISCHGCAFQANEFAGVVAIASGSLELADSTIEGTVEDENLGGGVGIFSEPGEGAPPTLIVSGTTILDNPIAGIWLSGDGSYALSGNTIHGGVGWTRGSLTKCGDAVYVRDGVRAWDGSWGLLLEDNALLDGLGAGLFLDDATATLSGNSYAGNAVDLVAQGSSCGVTPEGYEDEAFSSTELCPAYSYATCGDAFMLYLELALPKSGPGQAQASTGPPRPVSGALPAFPRLSSSPRQPRPEIALQPPRRLRALPVSRVPALMD